MLLPRPDEHETWERLDELLTDLVQDHQGRGRRGLVVAHAATLFAGIESPPALEDWPLATEPSKVSVHWIERVVGIEIDRVILRILQTPDRCPECSIAWIRHLIESRITLSQWAWTRDAEAMLD